MGRTVVGDGLSDGECIASRLSGVRHRVVRSERADDVRALAIYIDCVRYRLTDPNRFCTLAFDCEGCANLSEEPHSMISLQFGEILDETVDLFAKPDWVSGIDSKPGFIVIFPASRRVIGLLSLLFGHRRIALVAFDFTADVAVMEEEGISVNVSRLLDPQLYGAAPSVTCVQVCGIARFLADGPPIPPDLMEWDASRFVALVDGMPASAFVNGEVLQHGADDVDITALALVRVIMQGQMNQLVQKTPKKVAEFRNLQRRHQCVLAPAIARSAAFFKKYSLPKLDRAEKGAGEDSQDLTTLLGAWKAAHRAVVNEVWQLEPPIRFVEDRAPGFARGLEERLRRELLMQIGEIRGRANFSKAG